MDYTKPDKGAIEEAKKHANGYVYVIEGEYEGKEDVPPESIIGAWKVNAEGIIEGAFIPNPNHKERQS